MSSHIAQVPAVPGRLRGVSVPRVRFGFTFIEMMVVLVIVAILAAIAYPVYREQIRKTRRADAQAVLMQAAQFEERQFTEDGEYTDTLPDALERSPIDGDTVYYEITVTLSDSDEPAGFTLTATPEGAEAGAGTMTLDSTGQRTLNGVEGW